MSRHRDVPSHWRIENEFSSIEVTPDPPGAPTRLTIRSTVTGRAVSLDALELESLTLLDHRDFDALIVATVQADEEQPPD